MFNQRDVFNKKYAEAQQSLEIKLLFIFTFPLMISIVFSDIK